MNADNEQTLSAEQKAAFALSLHSLEAELIESIELSADQVRPVSLESPIGRVTRIDAIQQQKMAQASRSQLERRLIAVRRALRILAEGNYGSCFDCGEPIGLKRLEAKPETSLCRDCQEDREHK
jgi:DnaK suppressor protein